MILLLTTVASWVVAVATYVAVSVLMSGRISFGDTQSLALWGGVMVAVAVPLVYVPTLSWLQKRTRTWWLFPLVGGSLGAVPLMLFLMLWSGGNPVAGLFSPAGVVLSTVFVGFGMPFGIGVYIQQRHSRPA